MLVGSMLYFWATEGKPDIQEMLITLFLFITAPVSAHLLAKTGLHLKLRHADKTIGTPWSCAPRRSARSRYPTRTAVTTDTLAGPPIGGPAVVKGRVRSAPAWAPVGGYTQPPNSLSMIESSAATWSSRSLRQGT